MLVASAGQLPGDKGTESFRAILLESRPPGNGWPFSLLSDLGVGARSVGVGGVTDHLAFPAPMVPVPPLW
jgi:hypothetical protein